MKEVPPGETDLSNEQASHTLSAVVCFVPTKDENLASITIGSTYYILTEDIEQQGVVFYYADPKSLAWGITPKTRGSLDVQLHQEASIHLPAQFLVDPLKIELTVTNMPNRPLKATCYTIYYPKVEEGKIADAHIIFFSRKDQGVFAPPPIQAVQQIQIPQQPGV